MDNSVPEHRDEPASSFRELSSEPRGKVVSGKHNIFTHFPKDQNCDICLRTKITRASGRRRNGTVVPRAENLVIYCTDNSLELAKPVKIFQESLYVNTAQIGK